MNEIMSGIHAIKQLDFISRVTNGVKKKKKVRRNSAIVDLCQFFTCESAVCSNTYPAEFGEGTKLTVLGKITAS